MKNLISMAFGAMSKSVHCALLLHKPTVDKYAVEILKYSKCYVLVKNYKYFYVFFYSSSFFSKNLKYE